MSTKAQIIVIDGADSVGKATQVHLLKERLEADGIAVEKVDFPRYEKNAFGGLLRECLDGKRGDFMALDPKIAATLYAADRFESKQELEQWLAEGKVILFDRYVSANMMHQGAKIDDPAERAAFLKWLEHIEHDIFAIPRPDLTIHLSVPPEKSEKLLAYMVRIGKKTADVAESDREHQRKVAACAGEIAAAQQWVPVECMDGDVLRTREDIHEEVYALVSKYI